jgi:DNA-binding CsgD family transcriptional regulator
MQRVNTEKRSLTRHNPFSNNENNKVDINMIYLLTNNYYLRIGILNLLHPFEIISLHSAEDYNKANPEGEGVIIIDDSFHDPNLNIKTYSGTRLKKTVFIKTNKGVNIDFRKINIRNHVLEQPLNLMGFRLQMIKIINQQHDKESLNPKMMLSSKEFQVLLATTKGRSVRAIAHKMELKDKTIYNYRKSACLKLGVGKFSNIILAKTSFLIALLLTDEPILSHEEVSLFKDFDLQ